MQGSLNEKYVKGAFLGEDNYIFSTTNIICVQDYTFIESTNYFNDFMNVVNKDEKLFYKTDYHWNMNGTYKAHEYIINSLNSNFKEIGNSKLKDEFNTSKYEKYFVDTDGRKVVLHLMIKIITG